MFKEHDKFLTIAGNAFNPFSLCETGFLRLYYRIPRFSNNLYFDPHCAYVASPKNIMNKKSEPITSA